MEIQRDFGLWQELVPVVHWKCFIGGAQHGDEVVLVRSDTAFSCVPAVTVRWDQLEIDVLELHMALHVKGCFVVKALELWSEATRGKSGGELFVCTQ